MHAPLTEEGARGARAAAGGAAAASAAAAAACAPASSDAAGDAAPPLLELPEEALIVILSHLRDPLPLARACRRLAALSACRGLHLHWLLRHGAAAAPLRPPAGRLLTFRPLAGALPRELAALLVQYCGALAEGGGGGGRHSGGSSGGGVPDAAAVAEARAALRLGQDPLRVLQLLCPHPRLLLLPYLSMGGHTALALAAAAQLASGADGAGGPLLPVLERHPELGRADVLALAVHSALAARQGALALDLLGGGAPAADATPGGPCAARCGPPPGAPAPPGADELAAYHGCEARVVAALHDSLHRRASPDNGSAAGGGAGYLLAAAAAASGAPALVAAAAAALADDGAVTRQLPAALCLAGRAGAVAAVEALLSDPRMSSRPLEIAAYDAASRGWPPAALRPVLAAVVARYREDATRMLAGPMEKAVAAGRSDLTDEIWGALVQGRPEPERYTELIVRLAAAGDAARALYIADVAPPVMVKVGTAPAAAAAERGHERLAVLMSERAGRPVPGGRAAAARGRLYTAVASGDVEAVSDMLSEVTLGPGDLRRELLVVAAAAGDVSMLLLLLERLGPWMGEEVHALSALAPGRRAVALAALRAAAAPQLAARLLRTCCKLCGGWLEPAADVMAWALRETTNPAALDLMMSEYARAWYASQSSNYLGGIVAPHPSIALALSPAAHVWAELFDALASGSVLGAGAGGAVEAAVVASRAEARGGGAAAAPAARRRSSSGGGGGGGPAPRRAATRPAAAPRAAPAAPTSCLAPGGLAPGAARFTERMMGLVLQTGNPDLLYQALRFIEAHEPDLELA